MKIPLLLLLIALASGCTPPVSYSKDSPTPPATCVAPKKRSKTIQTTAYCHLEAGERHNAVGQKLGSGTLSSASADWSRYPYGTTFRVAQTQRTYLVDDYGPRLVGTDTIDLFVPTLEEMQHWGSRQVRIDIVQEGSYRKSLEILQARPKHGYIRKMIRDLAAKVR